MNSSGIYLKSWAYSMNTSPDTSSQHRLTGRTSYSSSSFITRYAADMLLPFQISAMQELLDKTRTSLDMLLPIPVRLVCRPTLCGRTSGMGMTNLSSRTQKLFCQLSMIWMLRELTFWIRLCWMGAGCGSWTISQLIHRSAAKASPSHNHGRLLLQRRPRTTWTRGQATTHPEASPVRLWAGCP